LPLLGKFELRGEAEADEDNASYSSQIITLHLEIYSRGELKSSCATGTKKSARDAHGTEEVGLNRGACLVGSNGDVTAGEIRCGRPTNIYLVGQVEPLSDEGDGRTSTK